MDKIDVLVNFGIELVATGVGAFLGYLVGLNQDRKGRESEDDESKKELMNSILGEIESNITRLDQGHKVHENRGKAYWNPVYTFVIDSSINSGKFLLFHKT